MKTRYNVIESLIRSKKGDPTESEDSIHLSENFVAVIDGVTSKTSATWSGETIGKNASTIINQVLDKLPKNIPADEAVDEINSEIRAAYETFKSIKYFEENPHERFTASLAAISLERKEVWLIGDCHILYDDGTYIENFKKIDYLLGELRSFYILAELQAGISPKILEKIDIGRKAILPFLKKQSIFQNNSLGDEYWYPVIDGFPIPDGGIKVIKIHKGCKSVILATDGYPILRQTLEESERELNKLLTNDPMLIKDYKATKGTLKGYESFDDRAFLNISFTL